MELAERLRSDKGWENERWALVLLSRHAEAQTTGEYKLSVERYESGDRPGAPVLWGRRDESVFATRIGRMKSESEATPVTEIREIECPICEAPRPVIMEDEGPQTFAVCESCQSIWVEDTNWTTGHRRPSGSYRTIS